MRIVSLLPSATEIVCALGLGDQLRGHAGRWHRLNTPAQPAILLPPVQQLPPVHGSDSLQAAAVLHSVVPVDLSGCFDDSDAVAAAVQLNKGPAAFEQTGP